MPARAATATITVEITFSQLMGLLSVWFGIGMGGEFEELGGEPALDHLVLGSGHGMAAMIA
jgi:hypothetical protein